MRVLNWRNSYYDRFIYVIGDFIIWWSDFSNWRNEILLEHDFNAGFTITDSDSWNSSTYGPIP